MFSPWGHLHVIETDTGCIRMWPLCKKTFDLSTTQHKDASPGWQRYALKATVFLIGVALLVGKENMVRCRNWFFKRKVQLLGMRKENSEADGKVCPICLSAPTLGVRSSCGHVLCADCLVNYHANVTREPLLCPLCRAPLNSIALASDIVSRPQSLYPDLSN